MIRPPDPPASPGSPAAEPLNELGILGAGPAFAGDPTLLAAVEAGADPSFSLGRSMGRVQGPLRTALKAARFPSQAGLRPAVQTQKTGQTGASNWPTSPPKAAMSSGQRSSKACPRRQPYPVHQAEAGPSPPLDADGRRALIEPSFAVRLFGPVAALGVPRGSRTSGTTSIRRG